jgi:ketosteroid isomerase-like protein
MIANVLKIADYSFTIFLYIRWHKHKPMKKIILPFVLAVCCAFIYSCNNEAKQAGTAAADSFNLDSAKAAIAASNATFGSGFATQDSAGFVSHYTSDACINPANMPQICGAQGIIAYFNGGYQMGVRDIKITTKEVMGGKDGVIETGAYEIFGDKGVSFEKGKFIVIWKEENGKWKMHRDIWNSDAPAPPPPAAKSK